MKKYIGNDPFLLLVFFIWVFSLTLFFLNSIGFVPYYVDGTVPTYSQENTQAVDDGQVDKHEPDNFDQVIQIQETVLPERLLIPSLQKDLVVTNPTTRDIAVLDRSLLTSVVRYPGSGLLGEDGNIFIFGHSTGYRTVNNELFKAFNGIQHLQKGALITLISGNTSFLYQVDTVSTVDAETALIDITQEKGVKKLTLSTCDSFGKKSTRFVVTATFLSKINGGNDDTEAAQ